MKVNFFPGFKGHKSIDVNSNVCAHTVPEENKAFLKQVSKALEGKKLEHGKWDENEFEVSHNPDMVTNIKVRYETKDYQKKKNRYLDISYMSRSIECWSNSAVTTNRRYRIHLEGEDSVNRGDVAEFFKFVLPKTDMPKAEQQKFIDTLA